jgi:lysophospholipase L1-like esterase
VDDVGINRYAFRLVKVAVLAMLAGLAGDVSGAPALQVWCVGDSIANHYAPALARLRPQWTVVDLGVGGERSDHGLERFAGLLAERPPPDVVLITFGTNDVVADRIYGEAGYGPARAAANVQEMAARARAVGAVAIVTLPVGAPPPAADDPPDGRTKLVALRRGLAGLRRALRPAHPRVDFRLTRKALFLDVVHPTPEGAQVIAERAAAAVTRALRDRPAPTRR